MKIMHKTVLTSEWTLGSFTIHNHWVIKKTFIRLLFKSSIYLIQRNKYTDIVWKRFFTKLRSSHSLVIVILQKFERRHFAISIAWFTWSAMTSNFEIWMLNQIDLLLFLIGWLGSMTSHVPFYNLISVRSLTLNAD